MISFGISTWSIHRELQRGDRELLDVPAVVRDHGMTDLQICHFHLSSRNTAYLHRLRDRIEASAIKLDALLLDFGDISHPADGQRDVEELQGWLVTAGELGARYARISAGSQSPDDATLLRSAEHLLQLREIGRRHGVTVITENWHAMMPGAAEVNHLRAMTRGEVPLCLDFGNWAGVNKYDELAAIASQAVTVHAKCSFDAAGNADAEDFRRCCRILRDAQFEGTVALIYDGPSPDEWRFIDIELELAHQALTQ